MSLIIASTFQLLLLLSGPSTSQALPLCSSHAKGLTANLNPLLQQVLVVGEPERFTFQEFAKRNATGEAQLRTRFAATGQLVCNTTNGESYSTAQLTLKNNILIASGHAFTDINCKGRETFLETCRFLVEGHTEKYKIKKIAATGLRCPDSVKTVDDWAVLVLEKEVPNIQPYAISPSAIADLRPNPKVLVAGYSGDYFVNGKNVRHIGRCPVRRPDATGLFVFHSECDSSFGSSGSGTFRDDIENPTLLGIIVGGVGESQKEFDTAVARQKPIQKPWGANVETTHVTIAKDFRRAILKAAEEN
jgi:hypothetical protein